MRRGRRRRFAAAAALLAAVAGVLGAVRMDGGEGPPSGPPAAGVASASPDSPPPGGDPGAASEKRERRSQKPEKRERERYHPTGKLVTAEGRSRVSGGGPPIRFIVEVEEGIKEDPEEFARWVEKVLFDRRSWPGSFRRVDRGAADFHVVLASPELTDRLCAPLVTGGIYSCYQDGNAVLNSMRWKRGASAYGSDLRAYRIYMINHEVGHALGKGHAPCPGAGERAPVMMQQTKGVTPCRPSPWPLPWE